MTVRELVDKSEVAPAVIARKIDMQRGVFNNKLKGNNGASFNIGEVEQIKAALMGVADGIMDCIKQMK